MENKYKWIYKPMHPRANNKGCVYEHIVVAENKLGRLLNDGECVHHLNEIKNDNRDENLIVFKTNSHHISFHRGCEIELEGDVYVSKIHKNNICPVCGTYKDGKAKLCLDCSCIASRKVERPTKEELLEMIKTKSFTQIGKQYGVTDNAVRKWCTSYGLPYKKVEIAKLQ